jgi:Putative adhesin
MTVSPTVSLRVFVPAGRVRIAVWSRDSIDVAGTIGATASVFGGGNRDYAKFGVEPLRTGDTQLAAADWVVTVPLRAHVWVKMTAGAIETDGTQGEVELYAVGGSITVRRASGNTSVESIDAAVSIESSRGDLRVRGGKATLMLRDVTGTASVTSVSGNVELRGTAAPECRIETIGGNILVDVRHLRGTTLDLQTHGGGITTVIDASAVPLLDLASRSGVVTNGLARGAVAQGRIVARSFRGAITVQRRRS